MQTIAKFSTVMLIRIDLVINEWQFWVSYFTLYLVDSMLFGNTSDHLLRELLTSITLDYISSLVQLLSYHDFVMRSSWNSKVDKVLYTLCNSSAFLMVLAVTLKGISWSVLVFFHWKILIVFTKKYKLYTLHTVQLVYKRLTKNTENNHLLLVSLIQHLAWSYCSCYLKVCYYLYCLKVGR